MWKWSWLREGKNVDRKSRCGNVVGLEKEKKGDKRSKCGKGVG